MEARWLDCPQCGRRVRLTAAELESKRGFCASCDARFELGTETRLGDGPGRELVHIPAYLDLARPPGDRLVVRSTSPLEVDLHTRRSLVLCVVAAGAAALLAAVSMVAIVDGAAFLALMLWSNTVLLASAAWGWRPRHDTLAVHPGLLALRSGRRITQLALHDRSDIAVAGHALVVTTDEGTVEVGQGLMLLPDELRWLRDAVRAAARTLPGPDPDRGDDAVQRLPIAEP